jgi:hypothetical protein
MNLKNIGKVVTSKFFETGPSFYKKKRIYRAAVSQRLRNTVLQLWLVNLMENYMQRVPEADVQTFRTCFMYSASRVTFLEMQRDLVVNQQSAFYRKSPSNDTQLDTLP